MKISEYPGLIYGRFRKPIRYAVISVIIYHVVVSIVLSHFQAEAEIALNFISSAQHGHYQGNGVWAQDFGELGLGFGRNSKYALFIGPERYEGRPLEELGLSLPVDFESLHAPEPRVTDDGFVAVAVGNIDFDRDLDVWIIDQGHLPENVQSDLFSIYKFVRREWGSPEGTSLNGTWFIGFSLIVVLGAFCAWIWLSSGR